MKRFLRVGASAANVGGASSNDLASGGGGGQSSSSRAAEPREEPGPPGGGGGQSSSSRAEPCVDLEVSSNSSGEDLGAATLPEGVDVKWAQLPESGPLARWCGARAFSVCRRVARVLAATDIQKAEGVSGVCGQAAPEPLGWR